MDTSIPSMDFGSGNHSDFIGLGWFRGPTFSDMQLSLEWPMDLVLWRFGWAVGRAQINGTVAETLNDCSLSGLPTEMI